VGSFAITESRTKTAETARKTMAIPCMERDIFLWREATLLGYITLCGYILTLSVAMYERGAQDKHLLVYLALRTTSEENSWRVEAPEKLEGPDSNAARMHVLFLSISDHRKESRCVEWNVHSLLPGMKSFYNSTHLSKNNLVTQVL